MEEVSRLRAVAELTHRMAAAAPDLPRTAHAAASACRLALGGSFAAVSAWERGQGRLRVLANDGELAPGERELPADETYSVDDFPEIARFPSAPAWVATAAGEGSPARVAALRRRGRGCCVVAPVIVRDRAWGELYVARGPGAEVFGREETEFAAILASVIAAGLVQHERLLQARRLAFTDTLTGLANRRAVDECLAAALERHGRDGTVVSLVMCDLNGLKRVNDTYGHAAGDRLLERFGSVLSLCAARLPDGLAARLGGDEFCLLAAGPEPDRVFQVASEVCRRARTLGMGEGVACGIASTGVGLDGPATARRLFRIADAAQYRAKTSGAREPVLAGRGGPEDPVLRLADAPPAPPSPTERRRFRPGR